MRASEVSQSGLTHDVVSGLGFGLGFSMEALMETDLGLGEGKGLGFVVKRDEKEGDWRKREDSIFLVKCYVYIFMSLCFSTH